ncbi:LacI family DNA-binding transcriptional regulator [Novosphingobium sp. KCTC 2891]|uniref:LacI family DNA-binding transcriptional regulator n=1 Tax=Novosphingobium sp. KCTC 2891 TaxID=2989730 RepID=UPI0022214A0C|nr:LacI family DNA-binding transcriptional regulator [Novosphingobium sp. KCTC 2891]MCW1382422.1 LacI family DNA-binding transcriptional regulator [Novosphingobium sp. KCTC 2891]
MQDVAHHAGVSLKSVSRVVNREPHVSAKLRAKVEAAIAELDYVPDMAARTLAGSRAFMIGVLFDNPSPNYTIKVQSGVYRACVENQYHLRIDNIVTTASDSDLEAQLGAILRDGRCDGFVLTPPITDNLLVLDLLEANGVPYSRIAPDIVQDRAPGVRIDDKAAAALVADHFWSLGHRRFGVITGPAAHGAAHLRREGFVERIQELGGQLVGEATGGFSFEGGIAAGTALVTADERPTAIFACNDDSAAGAIVAISRAGLAVPRDVSICGFDDSWVAKSVWPYLTTIYQPIEEMAHAAATMLIRPDNARPQLRTLDFRLVERDSVAPPAA